MQTTNFTNPAPRGIRRASDAQHDGSGNNLVREHYINNIKTTKAKTSQGGDTATYLARPKTKPTETLKGKLNRWSSGYAEFIPQGSKPSNRTMFRQLGNSSFYRSEGEKESSYSLHINVDGKSDDPVAEMFEQFKLLTAEQQKTKPQLDTESEGRMLFDNGESLQVWLDSAKGEVCILSRLQCSAQIERQLLQAQSQMNVTLGRYRQDIISHTLNK